MTTENKDNKLLVLCSLILITILLLGSFVVSLKIENIIYLVLIYAFVIIHILETKE